MKELSLKIYGVVQDVSFRYYAKQKAQALGLTGWVRNESDGTVKAVAQGAKADLEVFLNWCAEGSYQAKVEKIEASFEKPGALYRSFEIRR